MAFPAEAIIGVCAIFVAIVPIGLGFYKLYLHHKTVKKDQEHTRRNLRILISQIDLRHNFTYLESLHGFHDDRDRTQTSKPGTAWASKPQCEQRIYRVQAIESRNIVKVV
ncbi:hypothetical protein Dda_5960 [Drechslerella dactyloides]|uniref:Uncharacterized protein n=1 Tax=Drechslerella dactyloides TaxID=74499 RepID=A0AAD6IUZ4_DREDA|nr:hypothetical protein Dda_5960 [Drechslerella dactyloides]